MAEKFGWKFAFLAVILGFIAGFASFAWLSASGHGITAMASMTVKDCFKYNGNIPDAYCDSLGNLHVYFKGSNELKEGWYSEENSNECMPCSFISQIKSA